MLICTLPPPLALRYILPTEYLTLVRNAEQRPDEKPVWILKPTDCSQGRKIFLIRDLTEISYGHFAEMMRSELQDERPKDRDGRDPLLDDKGRAIATDLDMATTLRMLKSRLNKTVTPCVKFTEMHIIQRYLERPLCFHGYKLDLRIYVLLISAQPLRVYSYRDCLVRFATQKYDLSDLENSYSHLTNTSINKNSTSYSTIKEGIRGGCKWSLLTFNREHPNHPLTSPLLWARIRAIINLTLLSIAAGIPDNGGCFELLGYDIIIDDQLRPWLLEVNTSPALGVECAVDREVKEPLIADLVDMLALQVRHSRVTAAAQLRHSSVTALSQLRTGSLTAAAQLRNSSETAPKQLRNGKPQPSGAAPPRLPSPLAATKCFRLPRGRRRTSSQGSWMANQLR